MTDEVGETPQHADALCIALRQQSNFLSELIGPHRNSAGGSFMISRILNLVNLSGGTMLALIVFALSFFFPTPAHAINGRDAVGVCIDSTADGSRCGWNVNSKGEIDICNKSGCVYCPSADSQCVVASVVKGKPTRGIPVGATVKTAVGTFTVSGRAYTGPILKAPTKESRE